MKYFKRISFNKWRKGRNSCRITFDFCLWWD